ncbi:DUF5722 domain-containing protein [Verrucomicrobiota bacterium sgz303538]
MAETPLRLDERTAHELQLRAAPDGSTELQTTGGDPWVITLPLAEGVDLTRDHVLAFDYFSLTGTDGLQVFLVPPTSEALSVRSETLGRSEGWTSFGVDLKPALESARRPVKSLRIDIGTKSGRTIQLRNLRLRPLTEQERAFEQRRTEQKQREAETERSLRTYLDTKFPSEVTQVRADERQITIEGSVGKERGEFVLLEAPIFAEITDLKTLPKAGAISPGEDGRFTISVDRLISANGQTRDRLFSRWTIGRQGKDDIILLSHARYCDQVQPKWNLPEEKPRGRKGLGGFSLGRPTSDLDELGISAVTVNILLGTFMRTTPGEGRTAFEYAGKTWYTDDRAIQQLDHTLQEAAKRHILVSAIILVNQASQAPDAEFTRLTAHPDAHPSGHFAMPNVTSPEGHSAYAAALDFLARRYSQPDGEHGRIHHWIVHNEVDAGWEWTNAGEKTALRYLDLYQRSMRTVHLIARQYDPHAKAFISLTHYWTQKASPHFYPSRDLLDLLLDFSHAEGDFDWAIAYHPYPQDLRNPRTWEDKLAQFTLDTPQITFKNIEVLDAWVRQPRTLFLGKQLRTVHLTEQGPNSPDYSEKSLKEQGAAMAYLWKKLERLDSIQVFHFHNWVDNRGEGGLRIGLRRFPDDKDDPNGKKPVWYVFQALDTPAEGDATEFAKPIIGIRDWSEVQFTGEIK